LELLDLILGVGAANEQRGADLGTPEFGLEEVNLGQACEGGRA
jgi:hypothetical protein